MALRLHAIVAMPPTPTLFEHHLFRRRLVHALDEAPARVLLLTAPAGFGKTVLVEEWLSGGRRAVWLRCTTGSADVAAFALALAEAAAQIVPGAADRMQRRVRVSQSPSEATRPYAEMLADDLSEWPQDAWVVIDDYHLAMGSQSVERFMDILLDRCRVRLVVTTRERPSWATSRRLLYREITELGREELAMTREEAALVLDSHSEERVTTLVTRAEGWPAIIGLAAIASTERVPPGQISESLFHFFAEEVLRGETAETTDVLLATSVLNSFDEADAILLAERDDLAQILASLEQRGLIQRSGPWRRYHPLLREFFLQSLRSADETRFMRLAGDALDRTREAERWEDAFDLAIRLKRLEEAADIVGEAAPALLDSGQVERVEEWLLACEHAGFTSPGARLARADILFRKGLFAASLSHASRVAKELSPEHPLASRSWRMIGQAHHLTSNPEQSHAAYEQAVSTAVQPADLRMALWGLYLNKVELNKPSSHEILLELEPLCKGDINWQLRYGSARPLEADRIGNLKGVYDEVRHLLDFISYSTDPLAVSSYLVTLAYVQVSRSHYKDAIDICRTGLRHCIQYNLDFPKPYFYLRMAAALVGIHDYSESQKYLKLVLDNDLFSEDPFIRFEYYTIVKKNELCELSHKRTNYLRDVLSSKSNPVQKGVYIGICSLDNAIRNQLLDQKKLNDIASSNRQAIDTKFFIILSNLVSDIIGINSSDTDEKILNVLHKCYECDFFDALVISYRSCPELLSKILSIPEAYTLMVPIMNRANDSYLLSHQTLSLQSDLSISHLTRREHEVLQLMCEGLSNVEIAQRLYISRSTAKVHVRHILRKLKVTTRLQAILQVRDHLKSP